MTNKKFYQMTPEERLDSLDLSAERREILEKMALPADVANNLIENQISEFELPLGLAQNFIVNGKKYLIPMATEEPSVIAAASNGAKIAGEFLSNLTERRMRGQIVFYEVENPVKLQKEILSNLTEIFARADLAYPSIVKRGGGLRAVDVQVFAEKFLSVDCQIDVQDAMGANIVNTILEALADLFRTEFPNEKILFSILSNYATESLVTATCDLEIANLSKKGNAAEIAAKIVAASDFAQLDPYRAATHNKGIMNGISAVILATGNDTRAIAAGAHAYAARNGTYQGLATWRLEKGRLHGQLTLPLPVASVGGGVKVLPKAQAALEILQISKAAELAQVIAAVGLAQNLAALRALVSEGIQHGHMSLQARSLAMTVGAKNDEIAQLAQLLRQEKIMNQAVAEKLLDQLRKG